MSRKKINKKTKKDVKPDFFSRILKNIISLFIIILALLLFNNLKGYKWLWNSLVMGNLKNIKKYPNLTFNKKYEIKCGFDYKYLEYIKSNTPKDAIILMASKSILIPEDEKTNFNKEGSWGVKNKAWATYFIYPRKLVYENNKNTNPFYKEVTHVAIANNWGYDKLNYKVDKKYKYYILPIKRDNKQ